MEAEDCVISRFSSLARLHSLTTARVFLRGHFFVGGESATLLHGPRRGPGGARSRKRSVLLPRLLLSS